MMTVNAMGDACPDSGGEDEESHGDFKGRRCGGNLCRQ